MRSQHQVWLALGILPILASAALADSPSNPQTAQFSIGPWTLLDSDLRESFGTGLALDFSYAGQLNADRGPWLEVGVGYYRASGQTITPDPTFEVDDTVMELVPISIGVRNPLGTNDSGPLRIYLGAGATWALQRWDPPFRDSESSSTFGAYIELRPELRLRSGLHVWVRQRLHLLSDNRFERSYEVNPSGLALSFGLRLDIAGPDRFPHGGGAR